MKRNPFKIYKRLVRGCRRCLFGLGILVSMTSCATAAPELDSVQRGEVESLVQAAMEAGRYPSTVVRIDIGGRTVYSGAFGYADLENEVPATDDMAYAIGSITKSVTALAILQLVESGKIDLDASLDTYLPEYVGPAASVPVRRLLDHTSGIPNYVNDIPGLNEKLKRRSYSREEMVAFFEDLPLKFPPGLRFAYTNSGYYLLGLIIEAVSGMDYYEFLQANIFDPLGMQRSFSGDSSIFIARRARGYALGDGGFVNAPPWHHMTPFAAGSLISTVEDVIKYRRGVFRSPAFSSELRDLVVRTEPMSGGERNVYSLGGLIVGDFEGRRKYSHAGDIWGFAANHAYYPDEDLTIAILSNRQAEAPALSSLEAKIARVVLRLPQPEIRDLNLGSAELGRYTGDYLLHPFVFGAERYGFLSENGKLFARLGGVEAGSPLLPLLAQGDGTFRASFDDEWIFEFGDADGDAVADILVSRYRGGIFFASRAD